VRPDLRVGLAISLGNSDISFNQDLSGNTASIFNAQVAAYGTWFQNGFFLDGLLGGGFNQYSIHDNVSLLASSRDANFNGTQVTVKLGGGYDWHLPGGLVLTPGLSFQDQHYNLNGYTTNGGLGPLNLTVSSKALDLVQSRIGARIAYTDLPVNGYSLTPEAHAYYIHNYGSNAVTTSAAFTGGGPAFSTSSAPRDKDEYNIGLGLTISKFGPVIFSGEYDYTGGMSAHDHMIFFRLKTEF
jgi:outer membrane autotransporter protein